MSEVMELKSNVRSFDRGTKFLPFSGVIIVVTEEVEYSAGTDTGRILTLESPWGSQAMADNILESIRGYQYQPYRAEGASIDPAAELGDAVLVRGVYSGIYTMDVTFGSILAADISAPAEEEIDHEIKYVPQQERRITRSIRQLTSDFKVQAGLISAEITERKNADEEIHTILKATSGNISALVTKAGGDPKSFGWELTSEEWKLTSNNSDVLKASKDGVEITGKITATTGTIGGFDIGQSDLTYNKHTWDGTNTTGLYFGTSGIRLGTGFSVNMQGQLTATSGKIGGFDIGSGGLSYNGLDWDDESGYPEEGIYFGVNGIQLGQNFWVDTEGNLYAASGTFAGTIYAQNIVFGEDGGYLDGGAISDGSLYGSSLVANTIGTGALSSGVNQSLGYANTANSVFSGNTIATFVKANTLSGNTIILGANTGGATLQPTSISYTDGSGNVKNLNVVTWASTTGV